MRSSNVSPIPTKDACRERDASLACDLQGRESHVGSLVGGTEVRHAPLQAAAPKASRASCPGSR